MIDSLNAMTSLSSSDGSMQSVSESRFSNINIQGISETGNVDETGQSFTDYFAKVSSDAIDAIRKGESASIAGIQGKQSVQNVVDAVMNAELTLQSAIAIRNKIVSAYQEVSRMAI